MATTKKTAKATKPAKPTPPPKVAAAKSAGGKLSALDAAAKVLAESSEPLTAKALIEQMAAKGYWTSPGGQTPQATLYAAILREINTKPDTARFEKVDRGLFRLRK